MHERYFEGKANALKWKMPITISAHDNLMLSPYNIYYTEQFGIK